MNLDDDGNPTVALGGKTWSIPQLAAKQNKIIDPLIMVMLPIFAELNVDKTAALTKIVTTQYDNLLDVAFHAIRRAKPETTREQFLDLPVTLPELIAAFSVIVKQTGMFAPAQSGEARGAGSPLPTGTESSPMSAT
jgi:hypothetical protein